MLPSRAPVNSPRLGSSQYLPHFLRTCRHLFVFMSPSRVLKDLHLTLTLCPREERGGARERGEREEEMEDKRKGEEKIKNVLITKKH